MQKPMIAILTGGTGTERAVSLRSAKYIQDLLEENHDVDVFDFPKDLEGFLKTRHLYQMVIPMMHGKGGEDGTVQGFLETLQIPYLFSSLEAQAVALNKALAKEQVEKVGLSVAKAQILTAGGMAFSHPVVVKPLAGGSSVATALAKNQEELDKAIKAALVVSKEVMVEDFLEGAEYSVGVIMQKGEVQALPVVAIQSASGFFDYDSKYSKEHLAEEICPAPISAELTGALQEAAVKAHEAVGAAQLSRSDFIVDAAGKVWFLEINLIPGMTETSLVPKAVKVAGEDLKALYEAWIEEKSPRR